MDDKNVESEIEQAILTLLHLLEAHKPKDRSDRDRLWAIAYTDVQKVMAFWCYLKVQR